MWSHTCIIKSLYQLFILKFKCFIIIANILFAFEAAEFTWLSHFMPFEIKIPTSFSYLLVFRSCFCPLFFIWYLYWGFIVPICIILHFLKYNPSCQVSDHRSILFISSCNFSASNMNSERFVFYLYIILEFYNNEKLKFN
jgi:hypothetical protein